MSCRLKPYITKCRCLSLAVATLSLFSREASGVMIVLDYSGDTFFAGNAAARNALEAAAADLSAAITTNLAPVDADVFTGVNGSTSATFDWRLTYPHPATGAAVTIEVPRLAANEVRVFAGARNLGGGTLGIGSTGGAGFGLNGSGFPNQWIGAVDAAEALSNAKLPRGGGPTMGSISGSSNFGGFVGEYSLQYGAMGGSISFDLDTDDDGDTDTPAELGAFWQFDHTAPVVFEKYDFYSVALHELMHALGIGQCELDEQSVRAQLARRTDDRAARNRNRNYCVGRGSSYRRSDQFDPGWIFITRSGDEPPPHERRASGTYTARPYFPARYRLGHGCYSRARPDGVGAVRRWILARASFPPCAQEVHVIGRRSPQFAMCGSFDGD